MTAPALPFYEDAALFGRDREPALIAFEPADRTVRVYQRLETGQLITRDVPFRPFLLLADAALLDGVAGAVGVERLDGDGYYRTRVELGSWSAALGARDHLRLVSGRSPSAPDAPYRFLPDPVHQFLLQTGKTSFGNMAFGALRRMAIDIEVATAPGFEFPSAERPSDRVIAIALADTDGFSAVLSGAELDEAALLAEAGRLIRARDPDVLEGHNIFRFDLEYLEARARRHRVPLAWGRDGSILRGYPARMRVAERTISYRRYRLGGRHIVDTWMLVQLYDLGARDLESYGLKEVARHFGVAPRDRTYLAPEDIPRVFREDPARLMAYAADDVRETLAISGILSAPYFVQAQALPFDYQSVILRGNATKIDALLLREHLRRGHAVPAPAAPVAGGVAGGYAAVFHQGVARDVLHVDVTSLYPSLMVSLGIAPASDRLGVFPELLGRLREYRVSAKRLAREAPDAATRHLTQALQQAFKILINSFYGYLGWSPGHWNDFEAAGRVTAAGRRLVQSLVDRLRDIGATVIEVDTDGLYFVPPAWLAGEGRAADQHLGEARLLAVLADELPAGIQLELDGPFPAMLSYKVKNYVLLDSRGRLLVKGSGLRSRGIELFQRQWMEEVFRCLLGGRRQDVPALVRRWEEDFLHHRVALRQFMKTETLQDSLAAYQEKVRTGRRNSAAAYELALRADRPYQAGDQISYYVSGGEPQVKVNEAAKLASTWDPSAPDENTGYYLAKLRELQAKFLPLIQYDGLRPIRAHEALAATQSCLDLDG